MSTYLVVKVTPCPCGDVPYERQVFDADDEVLDVVSSPCPAAGGTGWQQTEVPLEEALRELGVEIEEK